MLLKFPPPPTNDILSMSRGTFSWGSRGRGVKLPLTSTYYDWSCVLYFCVYSTPSRMHLRSKAYLTVGVSVLH
jgi:hypothetical protein